MSEKINLRFKQLNFQEEAAQAVVDCFYGQTKGKRKDLLSRGQTEGQAEFFEKIAFSNKKLEISEDDILKNVQSIQKEQDIPPVKNLQGKDFTVEMETGTGKTYVYIKTMYELHRHYGWSKFIVMVPSVAIREGVHKTFQITADHFQEIYGKKIRFSVYDSKSKNNINNIEKFATSSSIEVIIMNYQAFASRSENSRRIYRKLDEMQSRRPIDVLKSVKPILIIDEPQKFGPQANNYLKEFNSLFRLRYSATHKEEFNKIYRLDAVDAFNKKLVKKIGVKGVDILNDTGANSYLFLDSIDVSRNTYPTARLEFEVSQNTSIKKILKRIKEGDNLYELSNEMKQYKEFTVKSINALHNKIEFTNGIELEVGQTNGDVDEKHLRRIQIRETIRSHLEKEKMLYHEGIKVLSLFFIDEVAKYRQYNENGNKVKGEYERIFEEEYKKVVNEYRDLLDPEYNKYLDDISVTKTHNGYFSIDKKGKFIDSKEKRGQEGSDDENAYDLIMKDKEKLLNLDNPVRFIFFHSALREGRDITNVFQICTLKRSQAHVSKRQEIGRGLRICVDKRGERMDAGVLEEDFFKYNKLTVVASESYDEFAKGLQKEISDSLSGRPIEMTPDILVKRELKNENGDKFIFDSKEAANLVFDFKSKGYLDDDFKITDKILEDIEKDKVEIPNKFQNFKKEILELVNNIYSNEKFKITQNERENNIDQLKLNDNFEKKEFQKLWNTIKIKTVYEVDFNSQELIKKSVDHIDNNLKIKKVKAEVTSGEQREEIDKKALETGAGIMKDKRRIEDIDSSGYADIKYDLIEEIVKNTKLTRETVVAILQKIKRGSFYQYRFNPEDFIRQASKYINEMKASTLVNNIIYSKTDEAYSEEIFTVNNFQGVLNKDTFPAKKHIYDHVKVDSDVEKRFAEDMEAGQVEVYAKLPNDFKIPTPVGNYNPDWAIVFDNKDFKYIYFIAETKGSMESLQLRDVEQKKIEYAKKHFQALDGENIKYDVVSDYNELMNKIMK